jgi:hypothetical protein
VQVLKNIRLDEHLKIKEGVQALISSQPRTVHFSHSGQNLVDCGPQ